MVQGAIDVAIVETITEAAIKTAAESVITALAASCALTAVQLNNGAIVIIGVEGA